MSEARGHDRIEEKHIVVRPLRPADRARWEVLARGYKAFYSTELADEDYETAWRRLLRAHAPGDAGPYGLAAWDGERLVGIAHYLLHANAWTADVCYLQDLFVDETARGLGAGGALIEAVARAARAHGAARLYWLTQSHNAVARALYDRVAEHRGFLRYDYPLLR